MELRIQTEHIDAYGYREAALIALVNARANLSRVNNKFKFDGEYYTPLTIDQITTEYPFISARRATVSKMISKLKADGILMVRHIFGGKPCYRINTDITPIKPEIIQDKKQSTANNSPKMEMPSIVTPVKKSTTDPISLQRKRDAVDIANLYKDLVSSRYFRLREAIENIDLAIRRDPDITFERVFQAVIAYKVNCTDTQYIQAAQNFFDDRKGQLFGILDDISQKGFSSLIPMDRISEARAVLTEAALNPVLISRGINLTEEVITSMIGRIKEERADSGIIEEIIF